MKMNEVCVQCTCAIVQNVHIVHPYSVCSRRKKKNNELNEVEWHLLTFSVY